MGSTIITGVSQSRDLEVIGLGNGTVSLLNWLNASGWHGGAPLPVSIDYGNSSFSSVIAGYHKGTLEVIGIGSNGNLYVVCYLDGNGWQPGRSIGQFSLAGITNLITGNSRSGDLEVIGLQSGVPKLLAWLGDEGWNGSSPLPLPDGMERFDNVVTGYHDDTLEVIGIGSYGLPHSLNPLYVVSYLTKGDGWQKGTKIGEFPNKVVSSLVTGNTHSGDLQVIGLVDGKPYILAWLGKENGWQGSSQLPVPDEYKNESFSQLTVGSFQDTLEVIGLGIDGNVYVVCYISANGGWQKGARIASMSGQRVTNLVTGSSDSGNLEVIGLLDGNPHLIAWLNGNGWQPGQTLAFGPVQTLFANIPSAGTKETKFKHSDLQADAHIQGMSLWNDYVLFSHNKDDDYGYMLFGQSNGQVKTFDVQVSGTGGNGSDGRYYHPSGMQVLDKYVVIGVEPTEAHNHYGKVVFYDISPVASGESPILLNKPTFQRTGKGAACCGIAKSQGRYIVSVYATASGVVDIYTSQAERLEDASFGDAAFVINPVKGYDNLAMTSDQNENVYLFGLRSESDGVTFADYIDLYQLDIAGKNSTFLQTRHFKCESVGGEIGVHFRYGAGVTTYNTNGQPTGMTMYASARHFEETGTPLNFFS